MDRSIKEKYKRDKIMEARRDYIERRAKETAIYFIDNQSTLRDTAKAFCTNKSTVHRDLTKILPNIDKGLLEEVCKRLEINIKERHYKGGESTRLKYKGKIA